MRGLGQPHCGGEGVDGEPLRVALEEVRVREVTACDLVLCGLFVFVLLDGSALRFEVDPKLPEGLVGGQVRVDAEVVPSELDLRGPPRKELNGRSRARAHARTSQWHPTHGDALPAPV